MHSIFRAQIWELWRLTRIALASRIVFGAVVTLLLLVVESFAIPQLQFAGETAAYFLFWPYMMPVCGFSAVDEKLVPVAFPRPISTRQMVLVPMLYAVVTSGFCYALPALLFTSFSQVEFPLAGSILIVMIAQVFLCASVWSPVTPWGKMAAWFSVLMLLVCWCGQLAISQRATDVLADPVMGKIAAWNRGWQPYVIWPLIALVAVQVTIVAVGRQRRGDRWRLLPHGAQLRDRLFRSLLIHRKPKRPFSSPSTAQYWYELRRCSPAVIGASMLAVFVAVFFFAVACAAEPDWKPEDVPLAWICIFGVFIPINLLIGATGVAGWEPLNIGTEMLVFDRLRPMTSERMITVKIYAVLTCVLGGWLLLAGTAVAHTFIVGTQGDWHQFWSAHLRPYVGQYSLGWLIIPTLTYVLLCVSFPFSIFAFLAGLFWRPRVSSAAVGVLGFLWLSDLWLDWVPGSTWSGVWTVLGFMGAGSLAVGSLAIVWRTVKSGVLGRRLLTVFCSVWLIQVVATVWLFSSVPVEVRADVPVLGGAVAVSLMLAQLSGVVGWPASWAVLRSQ